MPPKTTWPKIGLSGSASSRPPASSSHPGSQEARCGSENLRTTLGFQTRGPGVHASQNLRPVEADLSSHADVMAAVSRVNKREFTAADRDWSVTQTAVGAEPVRGAGCDGRARLGRPVCQGGKVFRQHGHGQCF